MKSIENEFYNINDLRVVMIDKNYLNYSNNEYVNYFNENAKFIVEKTLIEDKDKLGIPYYAEYYTECLTEEDLSIREDTKPFNDNPKIFSIISRIPFKYLMKEEIDTGKISIRRLYKVLQDINVKEEKEKVKIKK